MNIEKGELMDNKASLLFVLFAIIITFLFQSALTYFVLGPKIGFDDANITQAYARNIADGYGYVYNVGGERVEGSTSLLWTLINAGIFLIPFPIIGITVLSFCFTVGTLLFTAGVTRSIGGSHVATGIALLLFNLFPGFFAWSLWSLMDITLWVFGISAIVYSVVRLDQEEDDVTARIILWLSAISLPIIRPEGIALSLGVIIIAAFWFYRNRRSILTFVPPAVLSLLCLLAATLWRIHYFGYPVPNTYYAKTSSETVGQFIQGAHYIFDFFKEPTTSIIFILAAIGTTFLKREALSESSNFFAFLSIILVIGGGTVYAFLGGDHFGSYRFLIFIYLITVPLAALGIDNIIRQTKMMLVKVIVSSTLVAFSLVALADFKVSGGGVRHELSIAVAYKEVGHHLTELFDDAIELPTLATIAAGGIKMGYPGHVFDVLGLNWVEMAHARDVNTELLKNHGGFSSRVFWDVKPDLVFPRPGNCAQEDWSVLDGFLTKVTKGVTESERFKNNYVPMCNEKTLVFASRELTETMRSIGFQTWVE